MVKSSRPYRQMYMLLRAVAFSSQPAAIDIHDLVRHVKMNTFYAHNSMRCYAVWVTVVVIKNQFYNHFADAATAVLRLVGMV